MMPNFRHVSESYKRKKNGKWHEYFSVVENRRVAADKTVQRTVLYLGEINSSQENRWRKTLEVFDEDTGRHEQKLLFADQTVICESDLDAIKVKLSQMQLCRPRSFGNCWLACRLWDELGLNGFWQQRIDESRGDIAWSKVLKLLVTNCLIDPASEFYVHRQWFDKTAMDELLDTDYRIASKDRLYRCLDRILEHKEDLCKHLKSRWEDMFGIEFDVLLYDLTSTYFEGLCVTFRRIAPPQKNYAAALAAGFSGFFQLLGSRSSILSAGGVLMRVRTSMKYA